MKSPRLSLRAKAIAVLTVLGLFPLLAAGGFALRQVDKGIAAAVLELHAKAAERLAAGVDAYVLSQERLMRLSIVGAQSARSDWKAIEELLRQLAVGHPDIREVGIVNAAGKNLLRIESGPGLDLSALSACRAVARKVCWSGSAEGGTPLLELRQEMPAGLAMRLTLEPRVLLADLHAGQIGGTGHAFVIDDSGNPVLFDREALGPEARRAMPGSLLARQALQAAASGTSEYSDGGHAMVGAYAPAASFGGAVLTRQPRAEAYWAARQLRSSLLWALFLAGMFAVATAIWISGLVSRPLLALSEAAGQVAAGKFPKVPTIASGDELQTLAETFERMVAELERYSQVQLERLLEAQRRMEAVLYSIDDGVLMTDGQGALMLVNRGARELLGLDAAENLEGRRVSELQLSVEAGKAAQDAVDDPHDSKPREITVTAGGAARILRLSARPVVLPKGSELRGVVLAVRDVTLEREIERLKNEFLHSISHDLRSPISSIIGFSSYLLKGTGGPLTPDQTEMVATIKEASARVLAMVNDILDLARMESGKTEVKPASSRLGELAERTARTLRALAQQRGLTLTVEAGADPAVEADPGLAERLIANLVGNAIKFARENGAVTVGVKDAGEAVEVSVTDDGDGIPVGYRDKIFEKFEQVPGTRKGGIGLGLTICRQIVQLHGGRIWVESQEGRGARFTFSLPKRFVGEAS